MTDALIPDQITAAIDFAEFVMAKEKRDRRNTLPELLAGTGETSILAKSLRDRIDLSRTEGTSLAASLPEPYEPVLSSQ
jgi:hypothetical protein